MADASQTKTPAKETEESKGKAALYYEAVGRRKESSARARLYVVKEGSISVRGMEITKGSVIVNGIPIEKYFIGEVYKKFYLEPFRTTNTIGRFATYITVVGGGTVGQLGAVLHALSRALTKVDPEKFRQILRKRGFLTRDRRIRERRKAGRAGKARAKKQSPKR